MVRAAAWLRNLDPQLAAGIAGVGLAGVSWIAAAYALVQLLADPTYLVSLYWAILHVRQHRVVDADIYVFAQLVGALFALLGTAVISLVLTLRGRWFSKTVPAVSGASSNPQATKEGPS